MNAELWGEKVSYNYYSSSVKITFNFKGLSKLEPKIFYTFYCLQQGCPTFHLPWAILEDENLVWAAHTFGLGRMRGPALAVLRSPAPSALTGSCDLRQQRLPASTPVALWD